MQAKLLKNLKDSKIQKVKEIPNGFSLELYSQNKRKFLVIIPELGVFISDSDYDAVELSNLGKILRDKLTSQRISLIEQYDADRIIEIETQNFIVFLEFFRDGNIILAEKPDKKIAIAKEMRTWRHRIIRPNYEYKYPPPSKYTLPKDIHDELKKLGDVNQKLKTEYERIYQQYQSKGTEKKKEKLHRIQEARLLKLQELTKEKTLLQGYVDSIYLKYADFEVEFEKIKSKHKHGVVAVLGIPVNVRKSLSQNIQDFFKKIKQVKKKIEGLSKSIEEVELKEPEAKIETEKKKTQKEWYENFRWFISSDNFLIVGGKDAKSNEQLIRKHMKDGDLVFHTDITGSPFVLIKNPNHKSIPEKTIEETAQFCASYSKAWKIGMTIADVYYVEPNQVKKEGGLPTGSFMIYGKRNWVRRITLELAIGIADDKIIYGPKSSVSKQTKNYFSVIPSEENFKVPSEFKKFETEILRVIPYGKAVLKKP